MGQWGVGIYIGFLHVDFEKDELMFVFMSLSLPSKCGGSESETLSMKHQITFDEIYFIL